MRSGVNERMHEYPQVLQTTKVIGTKVLNRTGEQLGNLKELVIDLEEGRVAYTVLWRVSRQGR
jgi:sporulation protein YlmC with PRC-barrel domain